MKKYLLPKTGKWFKANLHCHSTNSDGKLTVEELKAHYMENGYSIIAFTDHELLMDHSALTDENFLALTGYEIAVNTPPSPGCGWPQTKTTHLNLIAREPHNMVQVCYNPAAVWADPNNIKNSVKYAGDICVNENTPAGINKIVRTANENGFLVTYNHPYWSLATYDDYKDIEGLFAVEVCNGGCVCIGTPDDASVYDDMLRLGRKLFCLATDDNHNRAPKGTPEFDSCRGWVVIKAKELSYPAVIDALVKGHFYSSSGPSVKSIWYEDGSVRIRTSAARSITMNPSGRNSVMKWAPNGKSITEAAFKINPDHAGYVRFTVTDKRGYSAWTNAYRLPLDGE